jgi:hypothetical protein
MGLLKINDKNRLPDDEASTRFELITMFKYLDFIEDR